MTVHLDPSYKAPIKGTVQIGDTIPDTDDCMVIICDRLGAEIASYQMGEDDLIPRLARLGFQLGTYLGNNAYNLI